MKFITVRDLRTKPKAIWQQLPEEGELVITNNGRPIALLTPVSDTNLEAMLKAMRRANAVQAVSSMQAQSLKRGNDTMTDEEISSEIAKARMGR